MYDAFAGFIGSVSNFMYSYLLIVLLLGVGAWFTLRTGFVQIRMLFESMRIVGERTSGDKVSSFQALMVSTASRVGTGNLVGVANAIALGGRGAVFWMWVTALLGGASAFIESTLAQVYKRRGSDGGSYGGPAYYIEAALHSRALGIIFSLALVATYAGGYNMLASFNLVSSLSGHVANAGDSQMPLIASVLLAASVGVCIFGGGRRITKVTSVLVPIMGVSYILIAAVIIGMNADKIPDVFASIFREAFDFRAIFGGFAGSCVMLGIKRGLYSNEAGIGSAPNAAAAADVSHPAAQGLVQMLSVFIDTLLICTATAMICLFSGLEPSAELTGAQYVQRAISANIGAAGPYFVTFALILFAYTTLLGNLFYCYGCLNYIAGRQLGKAAVTVFNVISLALILVGAQLEFGLAWDIADVLGGLMALINLPTIFILGGTAIAVLNDYTAQRRGGVLRPIFRAANAGLDGKTEFWND